MAKLHGRSEENLILKINVNLEASFNQKLHKAPKSRAGSRFKVEYRASIIKSDILWKKRIIDGTKVYKLSTK